MAKPWRLESLFLGEDRQFVLRVTNEAETQAIDITGWALSWMVKRNRSDADGAAVLTKTTASGSIVINGVFNSDPDVNAQVPRATVEDTDTDGLDDGLYHAEWKRTDAGLETVLAYGPLRLVRGVHHA